MKESMARRLCQCIKSVRKSGKGTRKAKEQRAIAICVKSVIQRRGKTLKRFSCGKTPKLLTQPPKSKN
jgi:hypothetical protein